MKETVEKQSLSLGIELGSTRIKAVAIDEDFRAVSSGDYTWVSRCENGIWTYPLEQVWEGLRAALSGIADRERISALGISGMMHGYLAFDKDWSLLVPFRTWQNTMTAQAAAELTEVFGFNIPQRWSIAHLYQAVLNGEAHIEKIAHITTLAGFVHYKLTGVNAVGIGEDSGIFPIDSTGKCYDKTMLHKFSILPENRDLPWRVEDVLPRVLVAGESAGQLTAEGAALLGGLLPAGIPLAPPEGDAGTGMAATNAVAPASGNVSAGTSIFAMVVLDKPLSGVYPEIDMVTTPTGEPVAMVHCNNCTNDMNAWAELLRQNLALFGCTIDRESLFTKLYEESLNGDPDCGGITVCNYLAGEPVTGFGRGCPPCDADAAEHIYTGKFHACPALFCNSNAGSWHGYSEKRECPHFPSYGSRRLVQNACCWPTVPGCRCKFASMCHENCRRGRPVWYGTSVRLLNGWAWAHLGNVFGARRF